MAQSTKSYRIYPSIGVARLGNGPASKQQVIFTPEIPCHNLYETDNDYLTADGRIKKQAQRFYIYECVNGKPVKRINPADFKNIEWHAEVANKKPFWYNFNNSLDLSIISANNNVSPDFAKNQVAPGIPAVQRNPNVLDMNGRQGDQAAYNYRRELVNHPDAVTVSSKYEKTDIVGSFPFPFRERDNKEYVASVKKLVQSKVAASNLLGAEANDKEREEEDKILGKIRGKSLLAESKHATAQAVKLGTVEYDNGTLIFYAADGKSASLNPSDLNTDFADNANWYDDICDGRITATLTLSNDEVIELNDDKSAAWIVTAPPDYAPQIQPISTLFDMVLGAPGGEVQPDVTQVWLLLYRLYRMQWVNLGDFLSPSFKETIDKLIRDGKFEAVFSDSEDAKPIREHLFNMFRNPAYPLANEPIIPSNLTTNVTNRGSGTDELKLPYYPGDGINFPGSPAQWFAIPPILYEQLKLWRDGIFGVGENNVGKRLKYGSFANMDELGQAFREEFAVLAKEAPETVSYLMTRTVLESLYGGGFHPGVELTWPMRHNLIYSENSKVDGTDFFYKLREVRINAASKEEQEAIFFNDFGLQMGTEDIKESMDSANPKHWLWKITPGDLTKWMGIPWQSDAGSCQLVFIEKQYPTPAWWAATLPVSVLPEESYHKLIDPDVLDDTKRNIYANRLEWLRTTNTGFVGYHAEGGYMNGLISMVYQWNKIGMVTGRRLDNPIPGIPEIVYVAFKGKDADEVDPVVLSHKNAAHTAAKKQKEAPVTE